MITNYHFMSANLMNINTRLSRRTNMFKRLVISIMLCAGIVSAVCPASSYALNVTKIFPRPASPKFILPYTDPLGYWAAEGMSDYLLFESIESGMGFSTCLLEVTYQPGYDQLPETSPVEVAIRQLSARGFEFPLVMIGIPWPQDGYTSMQSYYYHYFTKTLGITTVTLEVLSSGDTIEPTDSYYGTGVMSSNAEKTKITFTTREPGEYLNPWDGTSLPAYYPPILSFPTFSVSDHNFKLEIKVSYAEAEPDWFGQLYTENITLGTSSTPIDMGIEGVFSLGLTAAAIDQGIEINANGMSLEPDETHVTLGIIYTLSEMNSADIDLTSMHMYRHDTTSDTWVLAGRDGNINNSTGQFISGVPTDQPGDYGTYINETKNYVLVWSNIDNPSTYTVAGKLNTPPPTEPSKGASMMPVLNLLLED